MCRKSGNPFNTSIIPSPPAVAPSPAPVALSPEKSPWKVANRPSAPTETMHASARKSFIAKNVIWIAAAGFSIFIALGICLFMMWCCKRRPEKKNAKKHDTGFFVKPLNKPTFSDTFSAVSEVTSQEEKGKSDSSYSERL